MNYGFNDDKEKVEVLEKTEAATKTEILPKIDIVTVTGEVTIAGNSNGYIKFLPVHLINFGFEDGNPENYMLLSVERRVKGVTGAMWQRGFFAADNSVYPVVACHPMGSGAFDMYIYNYNRGNDEETYEIRAKFIKV